LRLAATLEFAPHCNAGVCVSQQRWSLRITATMKLGKTRLTASSNECGKSTMSLKGSALPADKHDTSFENS
jgi:hypothetical protein